MLFKKSAWNKKINEILICITWLQIICNWYLPEIWKLYISPGFGFRPWWSSARSFYCSCLHFLLDHGAFCLQFCLKAIYIHCQLDSGQVTRPLPNISLLCLEKVLWCLWSTLQFTVHLHCDVGFESIWLNLKRLCSLITFNGTSSTGGHTCQSYKIRCFGSWTVPFLLHSLLFSSFWCKLIFVFFFWHTVIWSSCFSGLGMVCILW